MVCSHEVQHSFHVQRSSRKERKICKRNGLTTAQLHSSMLRHYITCVKLAAALRRADGSEDPKMLKHNNRCQCKACSIPHFLPPVCLADLSLREGSTLRRVGSHRFLFAGSGLETFLVISAIMKQIINNPTSSS